MSPRNVIFMGTSDFALSTLKRLWETPFRPHLVVAQPDKPQGRGRQLASPSTIVWAREHGLEVCQPQNPNAPESVALLTRFEPHFFVVVAYGKILSQEVLTLASKAPINLHASLLPAYRGAAPIQRALMAGESGTGVTTMVMTPTMDAGPILLAQATPIQSEEEAVRLSQRLAGLGAELLLKTLAGFDHLVPVPQDETRVTYAPRIRREEGLMSFVDAASSINQRIRGLTIWPGTWTVVDNKHLRIYSASAYDAAEAGAPPGTVVEVGKSLLRVACGHGVLDLQEVQLAGRRRMTIAEFLRGYKIVRGTVLGS